jgi:hypothetical protein
LIIAETDVERILELNRKNKKKKEMIEILSS